MKPVLLAGYGIRLAGMAGEFLPFAERLGIPVLLTWRAMDLMPDYHPLFFGRPGSIASKYANWIIQNCNVLVVSGARLDLPSIGYNEENFAPLATRVIRREADMLRPLSVKNLRALRYEFDDEGGRGYGDVNDWLIDCGLRKAQYPLPPSWVDAVSDEAQEGDVIVPSSSGMACEMFCQRFRVKKGQRVIFSPGLGAMGAGLPQAIGAAFAFPNRRVICIEGDGSIQLNIASLQTIAQHNLNVKLYVLDNGGYASIRNTQRRYFDGRLVGCDASSGMALPDIEKVCAAYGVPVNVIKIDPNTEISPRLRSKMVDGKVVPGRLEDIE